MKKYDYILLASYAAIALTLFVYSQFSPLYTMTPDFVHHDQARPKRIDVLIGSHTEVKIQYQENKGDSLWWNLVADMDIAQKVTKNGTEEWNKNIFKAQGDSIITIDTKHLANKQVTLVVRGDIPVNIIEEN